MDSRQVSLFLAGQALSLTQPPCHAKFREKSRLARKSVCIPEENMYDRIGYAERLEASGFTDIKVLSIPEYVYPGMARYQDNRLNKQADYNTPIERLTNEDIETVKGVEFLGKFRF